MAADEHRHCGSPDDARRAWLLDASFVLYALGSLPPLPDPTRKSGMLVVGCRRGDDARWWPVAVPCLPDAGGAMAAFCCRQGRRIAQRIVGTDETDPGCRRVGQATRGRTQRLAIPPASLFSFQLF